MTRWRELRRLAAMAWLALGAPAPVLADDGAAEAEALVRAVWFEGIPYERARALTPAGVTRLIELLDDPALAEQHANIVVALGMSENPAAYPALARLAEREPSGELGRAQYRVRNALPFALGHLARADRRALRLLERDLAEDRAPAWSFQSLSGERLRKLRLRSAISALGSSGLPEADELIAGVERRAEGRDRALAAHAAEARATCARVAREGAARVFREHRP
jgi:hypothetical protein